MDMNFFLPVKVIFGNGRIRELGSLVVGNRTMIVSDSVLLELGFVSEVKEEAGRTDIIEFCEVEPNPSCETVDRAAKIGREHSVDTIVAVGGGSVMDTAKAVACLMSNTGKIKDYLDGSRTFTSRKVRLICVPTTSGTGSEVTNVGVYTDKSSGVKKPMVSEFFWSDFAIVDPELTFSLPKSVTASTGLDALSHAIESYWAKSSQPVSESLAIRAIDLIMNNLRRACIDGDKESREGLSMASLLAGMAFSQTRTTILHAISFPLTNVYGVPHGFACALAMPEVLKLNYKVIGEKLDILIRYLGFEDVGEFAVAIEDLMIVGEAPRKLSEIGIREEDLDGLVDSSLSSPIAKLNPANIGRKELREIFEHILQ